MIESIGLLVEEIKFLSSFENLFVELSNVRAMYFSFYFTRRWEVLIFQLLEKKIKEKETEYLICQDHLQKYILKLELLFGPVEVLELRQTLVHTILSQHFFRHFKIVHKYQSLLYSSGFSIFKETNKNLEKEVENKQEGPSYKEKLVGLIDSGLKLKNLFKKTFEAIYRILDNYYIFNTSSSGQWAWNTIMKRNLETFKELKICSKSKTKKKGILYECRLKSGMGVFMYESGFILLGKIVKGEIRGFAAKIFFEKIHENEWQYKKIALGEVNKKNIKKGLLFSLTIKFPSISSQNIYLNLVYNFFQNHLALFSTKRPTTKATNLFYSDIELTGFDRYEGELNNELKEGEGTQYERNKIIYKGKWKESLYHGKGIFIYYNMRYEGDFYLGTFQGMGKYYEENDLKFEGQYENCYRSGFGKEYRNGELKYCGEYKRGMRSGYGISYFRDKIKYKGSWKKDAKHGLGKLFEKGELVYEGDFEYNCKIGLGREYFKGNLCYEGEWMVNQREGHGRSYDKDGKLEYDGYWIDGKMNFN